MLLQQSIEHVFMFTHVTPIL